MPKGGDCAVQSRHVLNQLPATTAAAAATPNPPINSKAPKSPRSRHELRQHALDATTLILQSEISLPLKKGLKNFISRLAHQTQVEIAWTRSKLDRIELSDIHTACSGKEAPKDEGRSLQLQ